MGTKRLVRADKIRKARRALDITQVKMAARLGVSQQQLSRIEAGECELKKGDIKKIARILELAEADIS